MPVIALISPKGGVGKTTLTANLAAILAASSGPDSRLLTVDMDPQNALRFHHHMSATDQRGLAPATLSHANLTQAVHEGPHGVDCLPYGLTNETQRQTFESMLAEQPIWLAQALERLDRRNVIIDTPPGPSVYMRQALSVADVVLVVLLADAASFATLEAVRRYLDDYCPPNSTPRQTRPELHYVVNQFDSTKALNRDVHTLIQHRVSSQSKLWRVHYDGAVEEALACRLPLHVYKPESAAASDLLGVAEWLKTRVQ